MKEISTYIDLDDNNCDILVNIRLEFTMEKDWDDFGDFERVAGVEVVEWDTDYELTDAQIAIMDEKVEDLIDDEDNWSNWYES